MNWPLFIRRCRFNLLVGLILSTLFLAFSDSRFLTEVEDDAFDLVSKLLADRDGPGRPVVWVDIDNPTFLDWGEPLQIPSRPMADLVHTLVASRPALLVLDFDWSRRSAESLAPLAEALRPETLTPYGVDILLMRSLSATAAPQAYRLERPTAFDDLAGSADGKIHWAAPFFFADADGVVRRWMAWQPTCQGGKPAFLPSVQLWVLAWEQGARGLESLNGAFDGYLPDTCPDWHQALDTPLLWGEGIDLSPDASLVVQRIRYRLSPPPADAFSESVIASPEQGPWSGRPHLARLSAKTLLNSEGELDSGLFEGAIVIVGASHDESADIHLTPMGWMPGSLIMANAIYSMAYEGQIQAPPLWQRLLIQAAIILVLTLLFSLMAPSPAMVTGCVLVGVIMVPAALWLIQYGIWLDFALPLILVQLLQWVNANGWLARL